MKYEYPYPQTEKQLSNWVFFNPENLSKRLKEAEKYVKSREGFSKRRKCDLCGKLVKTQLFLERSPVNYKTCVMCQYERYKRRKKRWERKRALSTSGFDK